MKLNPETKKLIAQAKKLIEEPVLSKQELKYLRRVKTTTEEAEMILARNIPLLLALRKREEYNGDIGCPHCSQDEYTRRFMCKKCRWRVRPFNDRRNNFFCKAATFGGVKLHEAKGVSYGCSVEEVYKNTLLDKFDRKNSDTFLQGHLEWASDMLLHSGPTRRRKRD